jgi:hypothetical protein
MGDIDPIEMVNFETGWFPLSMIPWIWPIGIVVSDLGQVMSKGGEIGTLGFLEEQGILGTI